MNVNGLEVTAIKIVPCDDPEKVAGCSLQAMATIVLNGCLCINKIRIVKGKFGPFISFPSQYDKKKGKGFQFCYPITKALQLYLSESVLHEWNGIHHEGVAA